MRNTVNERLAIVHVHVHFEPQLQVRTCIKLHKLCLLTMVRRNNSHALNGVADLVIGCA